MRITEIHVFYLRLPNIEERTDSSQDALLLRIDTDAGISGWGEVDSCPAVIRAIVDSPISHTIVTGLRRILIGEDPLDTNRLWHKMHQSTLYYGREGAVIQAMAGIDLALWDIKGKAFQQPVWKLLGGRFRDKLRTYSSNMFQFTVEDTVARLKKAKDEGFTAAKFGWEPFGRDARTDCAYLEGLRKAAGDDFDIMLDVGLVWDARTTIQRAKMFEPYNLFWIEEPVPAESNASLERLAQHSATPIAVGERLFTRWAFREVLEHEWAGIIQPDCANAGGISELVRVASLAEMYGATFAPHNPNGPVQAAASLNLAAYAQNFAMLETRHTNLEWTARLSSYVPRVDAEGYLALPEGPGLGVEIDEDFLKSQTTGQWIPESFRADGSIGDW